MFRLISLIIIVFFSPYSFTQAWIDFEWNKKDVGGRLFDKAAILIPISEQQYLQLDTGSTVSYLYKPAYSFEGSQEFSFKTSNEEKITQKFKIHHSAISSADSVGTLGADYFSESILVIDFPNQKFKKLDSIEEDDFLSGTSISWFHGEVSENLHITTEVTVGNATLSPILFDTGSSIFTLVLNKDIWQSIVSEKDRASPPLRIDAPSWGTSITLWGAKSLSPVCLGDICKKSDVYYIDDPRMDLSKMGLSGLMGNTILRDEYVLILDYINKKVGVVKRRIAHLTVM